MALHEKSHDVPFCESSSSDQSEGWVGSLQKSITLFFRKADFRNEKVGPRLAQEARLGSSGSRPSLWHLGERLCGRGPSPSCSRTTTASWSGALYRVP